MAASNILHWPAWRVLSVDENEHDYRITAERVEERPAACWSRCGEVNPEVYGHGTKRQMFMDIPIHGKRVRILAVRRRYKCRGCGGTFLQRLDEIDDSRALTKRLLGHLQTQSLHKTFADLERETGVSEPTIRRVFRDHVNRLEATTTWPAT